MRLRLFFAVLFALFVLWGVNALGEKVSSPPPLPESRAVCSLTMPRESRADTPADSVLTEAERTDAPAAPVPVLSAPVQRESHYRTHYEAFHLTGEAG